MATLKRVLIVGGGIGGLCTSIGLGRAGIESEIVEINQKWTVYGVGIIQPSNQLRALAELGLADACIERGGPFLGWEFCDAAGNVHARVPNPAVAAPQYPPINGIARPVLHEILTGEAARLGVSVRLGVTLDEIHSSTSDVRVRFSDGSERDYDMVIGADGAYSKVRKLLFGDQTHPIFNGLAVWRHNFPRPANMTWGSLHYGRHAKAGLVPMSSTTMYMFVVTPEPGNPRMPGERLHRAMRERLAEFTGTIADLREQIVAAGDVVYKPMEAMLLPEPWHRGRVLLIGDAAHATTPQLAQGASIAIEDAALLAQLLPKNRPVESLFAEFMRRRFDRCKFVVETSLQFGRWEASEFKGTPEPGADPAALMADAGRKLAQPY